MDTNMIKEEINRLKKRKKFLNMLLFPGFLFWCFIVSVSYKYIDVFIVIIENVFNIDNLFIILLKKLNDYFYLFSPLVLYDGCKVEINKVLEEIERLNSEYQLALDRDKKINDNSEDWIKDRDDVIKLYSIVERFEKLPRDKQMEVLNYIKGDLSLRDKYTYLGIDKLNDKYKEHLQTECEDIIFPDYEDENKNNYTKKREK